ncbi:hypothetical protein [Bizionia paragorgiae]|uniref:Uncharacterized protein n=1 Tax=Bizionia paragorgiae TaxID=283786 RepID=A0A1H4BYR8_BIZPA|nr:hypothetical protein [Bizionia paragorgiae]SEA53288.1 hypothetical protein SAMN04487990_11712 [Bizionia paragorgiae]
MIKQYFENTSLRKFIKSEFRNKKKLNGFGGKVSAFIALIPSFVYNYQLKKSWNELYFSIENRLLHFYPELSCKWKGHKPN